MLKQMLSRKRMINKFACLLSTEITKIIHKIGGDILLSVCVSVCSSVVNVAGIIAPFGLH